MMRTLFLQINNAAQGAEEVGEETISIFQLIQDGGWYIMGPLAIFSVMAVYIFFERYFAIKKASKEDKDFMGSIKGFVQKGAFSDAKNLCAKNDTPMARMIEKGVSRIGKPIKEINASIENVGKLEVYNLERNLSILATIAGAAPMIGFLGTVLGMIFTFHSMKISGNGVEISELSGGIMQAMVTTVAGLVIGIVAYIGYNTLVTKVDKLVNKLEAASMEFIDLLDEPGL